MNRLGRALVLLWLGATTLRMVWTGEYGFFVQQRMRIPLLVAAVLLLGFGFYEATFASSGEDSDVRLSLRSVAPRVGWLLVLPFAVLLAVAPTGLGAVAADRVEAFTPTESNLAFGPLDSSEGPVEMRVLDFLNRAIWDETLSLEETPVRLHGLVVNDPSVPDGFKLTRFMVSCCAADGIPLQVAVHGGPAFTDDTWVRADVVWRAPPVPYAEIDGDWIIEADAIDVTVVDAPDNPYESPY